ncbi:hypothetical protein [Algoriphagus sp.]|uniref:hypothetical protein n=1 Tax=Algoriphagus sp. TaxID=1872435 RepID=UPI0026199D22|nr:hypothetical protein [Algoriphagus sp.]
MKKYIIIILFGIISCTPKKEKPFQEVSFDEVIAIDTNVNTPEFSERFQSFDLEKPIWQYNEKIVPEELIEKIKDDSLLFKGQKIKNILAIAPQSISNEITSKNQAEVWLADSTVSIIMQNEEIISINFATGSNLIYGDLNLFSLTPLDYKEKFPGSYQMRNFTTISDDINQYTSIDSIKSLDFTQLNTNSGKLTITWINGDIERIFYKTFRHNK